jgi:hypothetical protein
MPASGFAVLSAAAGSDVSNDRFPGRKPRVNDPDLQNFIDRVWWWISQVESGSLPSHGTTHDETGADPTTPVLTTKGDLLTFSTALARLAVGTDGYLLTADSTASEGISWQAPSAGGLNWTKYTKTYSDLSTGATTNDIALCSLTAKGVILGIIVKHSTAFVGGAISAYAISIGIVGDLTKYAGVMDVFQAVADTTFWTIPAFGAEDFGSATSIRLAATSTGANLDAATAGSVDVYILWSTVE